MKFSCMFEILQFVQSENGNDVTITSLCFEQDEKLVHVEMSNGNTYHLAVK